MPVEMGEDGGKNLWLLMMGCTGCGLGEVKPRCQSESTRNSVGGESPFPQRGKARGEDSFGGRS